MSTSNREPSPGPRETLRLWLDRDPRQPAAAARRELAGRLGTRRPRPALALALLAVTGLALWLVPRPAAPPPPSAGVTAPAALQPETESRTLIVVLSSGTRLVVPLDPAP